MKSDNALSKNIKKRIKFFVFYNYLSYRIYTHLAVMSLVPETEMADVGKLISLWNLLIRKVTLLVLTTTSASLILPRAFGADCMTRIAYIYSRLSRIHSFHFDSQGQHTLLHCDLQGQLTLSILTSRDNTHSLIHLTSSSQPHEMYTLCNHFLPCSTFTVRLAPASKTTVEISSNHWKKQTTNMGEHT